jgi:N utilization substance protein B
MSKRSQARGVALQMLYQVDLNPAMDDPTTKRLIEEQLKDQASSRFAWQLYAGVRLHLKEIDEKLAKVTENWKISRMAPTDRNALRVGAFELLYTETPAKVIVDETVELAKTFGTNHSSSFVNGVLDKIIPPEKRVPFKKSDS